MNGHKGTARCLGLLAALCALAPAATLAAWSMPVQGVLTDAEGTAIDGFIEASFALYGAEADTVPVWAELVTLDVRNGAFTTYLGATAPVMPSPHSSVVAGSAGPARSTKP